MRGVLCGVLCAHLMRRLMRNFRHVLCTVLCAVLCRTKMAGGGRCTQHAASYSRQKIYIFIYLWICIQRERRAYTNIMQSLMRSQKSYACLMQSLMRSYAELPPACGPNVFCLQFFFVVLFVSFCFLLYFVICFLFFCFLFYLESGFLFSNIFSFFLSGHSPNSDNVLC